MATVTLRKKAPFFCRTGASAGKSTCLVPLTDKDGSFCPACVAKQVELKKKADAPVHPVRVLVIDESANWRPSGRTGPIWPS